MEVKNLAPQLPYLANTIHYCLCHRKLEKGTVKETLQDTAQLLHKYNAAYQAAINGTEEFILQKLSQDKDLLYIMCATRRLDKSALPRRLKVAQINADKEKMAAEIEETSRKLALSAAEIDRLKNNELNRQLNFHCKEEKKHRWPLSDLAACISKRHLETPRALKDLRDKMKTKEKRGEYVNDSPVQSGLLPIFGKTETETGPGQSQDCKRPIKTDIDRFTSVLGGSATDKNRSQPVLVKTG
ncbi:hypothetical protein BJ912DRAFT_930942 [Pholiota molesta]|nr:hypothetical protein BJ912DRAFT_930942 [Pholiota molesta]